MGGRALIPLKAGRLRPKSAKDAEERIAVLPRVLDKVGSGLFPRRKLGARFPPDIVNLCGLLPKSQFKPLPWCSMVATVAKRRSLAASDSSFCSFDYTISSFYTWNCCFNSANQRSE
jgi:hypothetical protein